MGVGRVPVRRAGAVRLRRQRAPFLRMPGSGYRVGWSGSLPVVRVATRRPVRDFVGVLRGPFEPREVTDSIQPRPVEPKGVTKIVTNVVCWWLRMRKHNAVVHHMAIDATAGKIKDDNLMCGVQVLAQM